MAAPQILTIIQARLGSTRLPRKVLADINGMTMLERVYRRAEQIGYPVSVTIPKGDLDLGAFCLDHDWVYHPGPEEDVLAQYVEAARALDADHVIRVTADCPFLDVEAAQWTVHHHLAVGADLTTFHLAEGRGVEVFTRVALEWANQHAARTQRHSPDVWLLLHGWVEHMKFSVDTAEDLERARERAA